MQPTTTKTFRELIVWQKAHPFVLNVYRRTDHFPKSELFGLTSQFRRSAVSIPANIAEGYAKSGKADKLRYLNIAQGSLEESRYYVILAQDLNYCAMKEESAMIDEIARMLNAYRSAIIRDMNAR